MPTQPSSPGRRKGESLRLSPKTNLVASTVELHRASMLKAMETAQDPVVLDLATVDQIDSLGISLLLGLFKTCSRQGLPFSVVGVRPDIARVFRLFKLSKLFPVAEA